MLIKPPRLLTFMHGADSWAVNAQGLPGCWTLVRADIARSLASKGWQILDAV